MKFLHMSDLHFGKGDYTAQVAIREFARAFELLNESGYDSFHYMFVTGDLLYGPIYHNADKEDRSRIVEALRETITSLATMTGVQCKNIFIVPGNHDAKRGEARERICKPICGSYATDVGITPAQSREMSQAFEGYIEIYQAIMGKEPTLTPYLTECNDINVLALNTALSSFGDFDEGHLIIDMKNVHSEFMRHDKTKPLIIIGHHPLENLVPGDKEQLLELLRDCNKALYLCGHEHGTKRLDLNGIPQMKCGTLMSRNRDNSYTDMQFYAGKLDNACIGEVLAIKWDRRFNIWLPDSGVSYAYHKKMDGKRLVNQSDENKTYRELCATIENGSSYTAQELTRQIKKYFSTVSPIKAQLLSDGVIKREGKDTFRVLGKPKKDSENHE